jgi:hypothetical protein
MSIQGQKGIEGSEFDGIVQGLCPNAWKLSAAAKHK